MFTPMRSSALALCLALVAVSHANMCPPRHVPGINQININVLGRTRTFYVFIPDNMPTTPSPAIFSFHGCGSSPLKFEFESALNTRAEKALMYNIYLEGTDNTGGASPRLGWNSGFSQCNTRGEVNDVEFAKSAFAWVRDNLCVEEKHIFAAGFSNGGSMVFNLTCEMNDYFAAFAFAGSTMPASAYPDSESCNVPTEKMKPMLGLCGGTDGCSSTIEPWFGRYSGLYECTGAPVVDKVSDTTTCYGHRQCGPQRDQEVEYCLVEELGHCWSGADCCDSQCINQSPQNIDYSDAVIRFFRAVVAAKQTGNATLSEA
eukprot:m.113311 g.113311  ORF g.113311 m.113311 type:complete len:316 (-) comp17075_c0_seq1:655-1602(-)